MAKKVLIIVNSPPFGTVYPAEAIRAGVAFSGMDLDTSLVFRGDGVFSLLKNQNSDVIGAGSLKEGLSNGKDFGLKIFADEDSLNEKKVSKKEIGLIETLSGLKIKDLVRSAEVIINL